MGETGPEALVEFEGQCVSAELWDVQVGRLPVVRVPIDAIVAGDSPRLEGESADHIEVLSRSNAPLPPVIVHRSTMRIVDGTHRWRAAALRHQKEIDVQYFDGSEKEAFLLAVKQNARHGLLLTRAERNAAATRIIHSHPQWSDRMIAAAAGLSPKTVGAIRKRSGETIPQLNARVGRDGRSRTVDIAKARRLAHEYVVEHPGATLREIAAGAGVSLATARDVRAAVQRSENPLAPRPPEPRQPHEQRAATPIRDRGTASPSVGEALVNLKRDPAVRFTDQGRLLLRLLDFNSLTTEQWRQLVENIPSHWVSTVAAVSRELAEGWRTAAQQMDERARSVGDGKAEAETVVAESRRALRGQRAV
ncbi:ParB/RepB/Spo0J family partition protein [Streptomyces sp. NPDC088762]|uniref:ParB/RepB/Spo0J family partition protein n=1 Tax=Streptomyces sp. NPDC088762 TaxID=3365891 RepID=UPI003827C8BA